MQSPKISKDSRNFCSGGFTLIEILVVLGILATILIMTPAFDIGSFIKLSDEDRARKLVQELQRVRSEAVNNIGTEDHTVQISGKEFVTFEKLTGNAEEDHEIIFGNGSGSVTVTINHEGGIDW